MPDQARWMEEASYVAAGAFHWDPTTSSGVVPADRAVVRIHEYRRKYGAEAVSAPWQKIVRDRITHLLEMPEGWDSYAAPSISHDIGMFALVILNNIMGPRTPAPSVVPTSTGGLQLEWHEKGIDLEIHVMGTYLCEFSVEDHRGEIASDEAELQDDFSVLAAPIGALTVRR